MATQVYINGQFYDKEDAKISVFDHGLLYGVGVFEGIRSYGGKPFRIDQHLERLWNSAKSLWFEIPISRQEMAEGINRAVQLNGISEGYIRVIVTRGKGVSPGLEPEFGSEQHVIIIAEPISLYPPEAYERGLEIVTASTIRTPDACMSPRVKSLNYLNNILAKIEAKEFDCMEAIMLNQQGEVAECTADNIFVVSDGVVRTPPPNASILEGVTRNLVIELCRENGIEVREECLTQFDIYNGSECFITGSAAEVVPVVKVDNRTIGGGTVGPVTKTLMSEFHRVTRAC